MNDCTNLMYCQQKTERSTRLPSKQPLGVKAGRQEGPVQTAPIKSDSSKVLAPRAFRILTRTAETMRLPGVGKAASQGCCCCHTDQLDESDRLLRGDRCSQVTSNERRIITAATRSLLITEYIMGLRSPYQFVPRVPDPTSSNVRRSEVYLTPYHFSRLSLYSSSYAITRHSFRF